MNLPKVTSTRRRKKAQLRRKHKRHKHSNFSILNTESTQKKKTKKTEIKPPEHRNTRSLQVKERSITYLQVFKIGKKKKTSKQK